MVSVVPVRPPYVHAVLEKCIYDSCSHIAPLFQLSETAALMRNILRGMSSEIICLWCKQKGGWL